MTTLVWIALTVPTVSHAQSLSVAETDDVTVAYIEGLRVGMSTKDQTGAAVGVRSSFEQGLVLQVSVLNEGERPITFSPTHIRVTGKMWEGTESGGVKAPSDVMEDHWKKAKSAKGRLVAAHTAQLFAASQSGDQTALEAVRARQAAEMANLVSQWNSAGAVLEATLLKSNTVLPGGGIVGDVYVQFSSGQVEHLSVEVPIGSVVHTFQFGDSSYKSDRCDLSLYPEGQVIGWVKLNWIVFPYRVGGWWKTPQFTLAVYGQRPSEENGWLFDTDTFVCSLNPGASLRLPDRPVRVKGQGIWVPVAGLGD